ncbi:MAG TPA: hypothetical protein HPP56_02780 [Nitrospirae bacterium]|nr:hypothetical protein [Nitrospirota bacterium]
MKYSEDVIIGKRGFVGDEQENGLVLVFNNKMNFQWTDGFIYAKLGFGTKIENCLIPSKNIISIFSPDINTNLVVKFNQEEQFTTFSKSIDKNSKTPLDNNETNEEIEPTTKGKVINVDFKGNKR